MKVIKCVGEGLSECKRCEEIEAWHRVWWASSLYRIEGYEGRYCAECVNEIQKETKER